MRVTELYGLDNSQAAVDFVNVDTATDNPVFIDPRAIRLQNGTLEMECVGFLVSFFSEVLDAIHEGRGDRVRELMRFLGEPNETHLGYSRGKSRGRGLTGASSDQVADAISGSRAAATGLLEDLEDTALLVPGVGKDLISDMTTQIVRSPLTSYTQRCCDWYEIPVEEQYSGPYWNQDTLTWEEGQVLLPRSPEGKLLLVPKSIVRHEPIFDSPDYFRDYLAPLLEGVELQANTQLVRLLKDGRQKVYRKDLEDKYGNDKPSIVEQTLRFEKQPLALYRAKAGEMTAPPLDNEDLAQTTGAEQIDFIAAYEEVMAVNPGKAGATSYHRAAEKLLTAIFYPALGNMRIEANIHDGRKRIDILYDNLSNAGFFYWLNQGYRCPIVPVECKNYTRDLANPELDQMIGRFSDQRGRFGIIVCRSFEDKDQFLARCRDTTNDRNGYIVALDDDDLRQLAEQASKLQYEPSRQRRFAFPLLRQRFDMLIN
jgi:hypothetical protein